MTAITKLADELRRAHDGDPWHGASALGLLRDVTPEEASQRPIPGAHTIREVVLHMAAWTGEVRRRLHGGVPGPPAEGDWPEGKPGSEPPWPEARARLEEAGLALIAEVERFPESHLGHAVGRSREAPLGTGYSYEVMLHGLTQHNAYHSGQIALLKKAIRGAQG